MELINLIERQSWMTEPVPSKVLGCGQIFPAITGCQVQQTSWVWPWGISAAGHWYEFHNDERKEVEQWRGSHLVFPRCCFSLTILFLPHTRRRLSCRKRNVPPQSRMVLQWGWRTANGKLDDETQDEPYGLQKFSTVNGVNVTVESERSCAGAEGNLCYKLGAGQPEETEWKVWVC